MIMFESLYNAYKHLSFDDPEIIVTDTHALMTRGTFERMQTRIFSCAYGTTCYLTSRHCCSRDYWLFATERLEPLKVLIIEDLDPEKSDREFYLDARRRLDEAHSKPYDR